MKKTSTKADIHFELNELQLMQTQHSKSAPFFNLDNSLLVDRKAECEQNLIRNY